MYGTAKGLCYHSRKNKKTKLLTISGCAKAWLPVCRQENMTTCRKIKLTCHSE